MKHPLQNFEFDEGYPRFIKNKIVNHLVEKYDLNDLAVEFGGDEFREDWEQLAQLIGYSLSGFSELSYVSDDTYNAAEIKSQGQDEMQARVKALEEMLAAIREKAKDLFPEIFRMHPDDLKP